MNSRCLPLKLEFWHRGCKSYKECFESRFKAIFSFQCFNWFTVEGKSFNRVEASSSQGSKSDGHLGEEISRRCIPSSSEPLESLVRVAIAGICPIAASQADRQTDRQGQGRNLIGRKRGERRRSEGSLSDRVGGQGPHADAPLSLFYIYSFFSSPLQFFHFVKSVSRFYFIEMFIRKFIRNV